MIGILVKAQNFPVLVLYMDISTSVCPFLQHDILDTGTRIDEAKGFRKDVIVRSVFAFGE